MSRASALRQVSVGRTSGRAPRGLGGLAGPVCTCLVIYDLQRRVREKTKRPGIHTTGSQEFGSHEKGPIAVHGKEVLASPYSLASYYTWPSSPSGGHPKDGSSTGKHLCICDLKQLQETALACGRAVCHTQRTDWLEHDLSGLHLVRGRGARPERWRRRGAGQYVEVVLCIVRLVTGLEKSPLAEVLTRHESLYTGSALGIIPLVPTTQAGTSWPRSKSEEILATHCVRPSEGVYDRNDVEQSADHYSVPTRAIGSSIPAAVLGVNKSCLCGQAISCQPPGHPRQKACCTRLVTAASASIAGLVGEVPCNGRCSPIAD